MNKNTLDKKTITRIIIAVGIVIVIYGAYTIYSLSEEKNKLTEEKNKISENLASAENDNLSLSNDNSALHEALETEIRRNTNFQERINELSETIGVLDKLSQIDPELLQKYSKVYFLNEHYEPEKLRSIKSKYVAEGKENLQIESRVYRHLDDLLDEAEDDGINLRVISAYRDFFEQQSIKSAFTVSYGAGANAFSADQGYSEHQLGTTVDFTTEELGNNYGAIENTEAYEWLLDNAYKYGFVLSYPKGNSYYIFEPWHWRFVGRDLARDLHKKGDHFYDWNQRDIDEYLIEFFE